MKKYSVYLDGKGYMISPGSFSEGEAPLFGSKFATGEPAYGALDFWQRSGSTDFHRGHNQKFHVDPAMFQESYGLELQDTPGEITLARVPETVTVPEGSNAEFTAKLVTLNYTYLGTVDGKIYKITHSSGTVALERDTGEASPITDFFEFTNPDDTTKNDIYACIPATGKFTWRYDANASSWATTDITGLRSAAVWGTEIYGAFALNVKYTDDPRALANFDLTAFKLPGSDVRINRLRYGRERLWIGTYSRILGYDGGGAPWELYDFSWARHEHNFKSMEIGDNYLWFNIYNQGIFYTNGATIGMTTIHKDSEFMNFKYAIAVGAEGPIIWAIYQDTDDNFWLAKSKYRNYWFTYCQLSGLSDTKLCQLFSQGTDKYIANADGTLKKLNSSCSYQTSGRLISSLFDANLILLDKLLKNLTAYHEPLATGQTVTLRANFDEQYTVSQFDDYWTGASHTYVSGDTASGFEVSFTGFQKAGRKIYDTGLLSQRFQYGVLLEGNGNSTPKVQDVFWTYYLERPYGQVARKKEWQFSILVRDELEKMDQEKIDTYETKSRTGKMILDELWNSRRTMGFKSFVGLNHYLTKALHLVYTGSETYCKITIDQVNNRLALETKDGTDEYDLNLKATSYNTLKKLSAYLNSLSNYTCSTDDEANLSTLSIDLLPVKEINIKGSAGATGKMFYTATEQYKVIYTSMRVRQLREKATEEEVQAILYFSLREL